MHAKFINLKGTWKARDYVCRVCVAFFCLEVYGLLCTKLIHSKGQEISLLASRLSACPWCSGSNRSLRFNANLNFRNVTWNWV
jgi:hypothetical protein